MNYNTDQILWDTFKATRDALPNLGAVLTVRDGAVDDGIQTLAQFSNTEDANLVLANAGLKPLGRNRWK